MNTPQMARLISVLISLLVSLPGPANAVSEQGYAATMTNQVEPFIRQNEVRSNFTGVNGLSIATVSIRGTGEKGDIIIVPGQGEFIAKYHETAFDLLQRGYSAVHIISHRGQGESQRVLSDPKKASIENFDFYVQDLDTYVSHLRLERPKGKLFLLAHSMGGAISALFLEHLRATGRIQDFDAVVLSSPMFEIKAPVVSEAHRLSALVNLFCMTGHCDDYALGQGHRNEYGAWDSKRGTSSRIRWDYSKQYTISHPEVTLSGPTFRWLKESIRADALISKLAPPSDLPMLVLQAGHDQTVITPPQTTYCAKSASCKILRFETSEHELLQESDAIRSLALQRIDEFFSAH
jgi:lysophospholipase